MQYCSLQHRTLLLSLVTSTARYCFALAPSLHSFWSYFCTDLQYHVGHLLTWGVPLSVSYHLASIVFSKTDFTIALKGTPRHAHVYTHTHITHSTSQSQHMTFCKVGIEQMPLFCQASMGTSQSSLPTDLTHLVVFRCSFPWKELTDHHLPKSMFGTTFSYSQTANVPSWARIIVSFIYHL